MCAVLAGASSVTAIADWLHDLDDIARARLGFLRAVPATTTMWRLLIRVDADLLATVLAGWLHTRTRPALSQRPRYRQVIAVDGKTVRGARRADGSQVHLLSALDTSTGIVLAQVTVNAKSNEIPAFTPLLDAIAQLKTLPWAQVPIGHQTRETGHGRRETRTVKAITLHTPGGIGFPHAQQAIRITRTRTTVKSGKTSREAAYLTITLPAADAHPADLQEWIRSEWLIENQVHHIRDVTFREDLHQARTGTGPAVMATLRNTAVGYHRTSGETNIARATRRANRRPHDPHHRRHQRQPQNAMTLGCCSDRRSAAGPSTGRNADQPDIHRTSGPRAPTRR